MGLMYKYICFTPNFEMIALDPPILTIVLVNSGDSWHIVLKTSIAFSWISSLSGYFFMLFTIPSNIFSIICEFSFDAATSSNDILFEPRFAAIISPVFWLRNAFKDFNPWLTVTGSWLFSRILLILDYKQKFRFFELLGSRIRCKIVQFSFFDRVL